MLDLPQQTAAQPKPMYVCNSKIKFFSNLVAERRLEIIINLELNIESLHNSKEIKNETHNTETITTVFS